MPPKVRVQKEEIVQAALEIVREKGVGNLNARTIAAALNCSTQPVFSNFSTMEELQEAVMQAAYERYFECLQNTVKSGKYARYKAFGMGYIRFAKEEKQLFKLLFMCDREGRELVSTPDWEASVDMIMEANGVDRDRAEMMHMEMWVCVHGIATMLATSFLELNEELASKMLTDLYQGIRHGSEEDAV